MAAKKPKKKYYPRPESKTDVFARLDADLADRFDRIVSKFEPPTTRSKVIAMIIRRYVEEREGQKK